MMQRVVSSVAVMLLAAACAAQNVQPTPFDKSPAKPKPPTGAIAGTVYCADTNLPARHAHVFVEANSTGASGSLFNGFNKEAFTDLEGRFVIAKIPEGRYFVSAVLAGYVNLHSSLMQSHVIALEPQAQKELESRLTTVDVSAKQTAEASIRLERGAEIDGTVLFDDGSPAIGLQISLMPNPRNAPKRPQSNGIETLMLQFNGAKDALQPTDDHGRFRVLGVEPGEYIASVLVSAASAEKAPSDEFAQLFQSSPFGGLLVYSGGSLRASKASIVKVGAGGTADANITIPLSKLHTVRGQIVLKSTGQPALSGGVQMLYADTQDQVRVAVAPNGEFEFHYVGEDSYILRAAASAAPLPKLEDDDGEGVVASAGRFRFVLANQGDEGTAEIPLTVTGDVDNLTIAVPDPPKSKPATTPESASQDQPAGSTPPDTPQ